MNSEIRQLQPNQLWNKFADLNAVPRASKKEERVIAFIKDFGKSLGLETMVDEVGNVIIKKPATKGMESKTTVVLQSHLDMVHQKNAATNFDFDMNIQLGLQASIGDKLKLGINYNTKSGFAFENQLKLGYKGKEDDEGEEIIHPLSVKKTMRIKSAAQKSELEKTSQNDKLSHISKPMSRSIKSRQPEKE